MRHAVPHLACSAVCAAVAAAAIGHRFVSSAGWIGCGFCLAIAFVIFVSERSQA